MLYDYCFKFLPWLPHSDGLQRHNINLFSPKFLSIRAFYHSNRNKTRMVDLAKMGLISVSPPPETLISLGMLNSRWWQKIKEEMKLWAPMVSTLGTCTHSYSIPTASRTNVTTRELWVNFLMAGCDRIYHRNNLKQAGFILTHGLRECQSVVELSLPIKTATISVGWISWAYCRIQSRAGRVIIDAPSEEKEVGKDHWTLTWGSGCFLQSFKGSSALTVHDFGDLVGVKLYRLDIANWRDPIYVAHAVHAG